MSDRYPGTTSPAIERRFQALRTELRQAIAQSVGQVANTAERRTVVISEDLSAHLAAPDPHPQYMTSAEVSALIAAAISALPAIPKAGVTNTLIPAGAVVEVVAWEQYLVFGALVIDGELILDQGELVVL